MTDFEQITDNKVRFIIDTSIYNDNVISKVLYGLADSYIIERNSIDDKRQEIQLEQKIGIISQKIKERLSRSFIDFKTRDIVNAETGNIRDILYIKAFANNDDFEDYNLTEE